MLFAALLLLLLLLIVTSQQNLSTFLGFHLEVDLHMCMSSEITHYPAKCEFQINNKEYFSISYVLCNI